jgi:cytochrome c oxidase subunit 2
MNETPQNKGHLLWAIILVIVFSIVGTVVAVVGLPAAASAGLLPPVASDRAADVDNVLMLFTLASIPVFMLVVVFLIYSIFAFRSHGRPTSDGALIRANLPTQIAWIAVSLALVAYLFGYGLVFLNRITAPPTGDVLIIKVTGEQWLWDYSYPQYNNATGTTLELPINRPVEFDITSIDVQHSFWIPAMGVKEDAVPGQITHITNVTPTVIGAYEVRCAELCGLYHAYMNSPVQVVSASDFEAWVGKQPQAPEDAYLPSGAPAIALTGVVDARLALAQGGGVSHD